MEHSLPKISVMEICVSEICTIKLCSDESTAPGDSSFPASISWRMASSSRSGKSARTVMSFSSGFRLYQHARYIDQCRRETSRSVANSRQYCFLSISCPYYGRKRHNLPAVVQIHSISRVSRHSFWPYSSQGMILEK